MAPSADALAFSSRGEFREWLTINAGSSAGVWLTFIKGSGSFTANDALEEAICFGWIDGVMRSVDESSYLKYFSRRKDRSNWSDKNRGIYDRMTTEGLMTEAGVAAFGAGPKADKPPVDADAAIRSLHDALGDDAEALSRFDAGPPSRMKRLGLFYGDAKTDVTKAKRLARIKDALKTGYTGMLY